VNAVAVVILFNMLNDFMNEGRWHS
jgi:hypothetical protein